MVSHSIRTVLTCTKLTRQITTTEPDLSLSEHNELLRKNTADRSDHTDPILEHDHHQRIALSDLEASCIHSIYQLIAKITGCKPRLSMPLNNQSLINGSADPLHIAQVNKRL